MSNFRNEYDIPCPVTLDRWPEDAKYMTQDADGVAWFKNRPTINMGRWEARVLGRDELVEDWDQKAWHNDRRPPHQIWERPADGEDS